MRYEIIFAPQAVRDFRRLSAGERAIVREALEIHLRHEPEKISKSRIKRLRGYKRPQYRLRLGVVRIYYDISRADVEILAIVPKSRSIEWLEEKGEKG